MSQRNEARPWLSTLRVLFKASRAVPLLLAMLASIGAPVLAADTADNAGRATVELSIASTGASLLDPFTLSTGIPIQNGGTATAENVEITSIALRGFMGGATLTSPTLPFNLGSVTTSASEGGMTPLFASFISPNASLVPGGEYVLIITGTYGLGGTRHPFALVHVLAIPEAAPGSAESDTATVELGSPGGSPGDEANSNEEDVNEDAYTTPIGLFVPVTPSASIQVQNVESTGVQRPIASGSSVTFVLNEALPSSLYPQNLLAREPSGATAYPLLDPQASVVFITANASAAYSIDGGATFTALDPRSVFPSIPSGYGGFCCDQIVQYVPGRDLVVWLMQFFKASSGAHNGANFLRLAVANTRDIATDAYTAWKYWDLKSDQTFGFKGSGLDFPDMAVGTNNLFISVDAGNNGTPGSPPRGLMVIRVALDDLVARANPLPLHWVNPKYGGTAIGSHLAQTPGDTAFWAGHKDTSTLRIFHWPDGSSVFHWRDRTTQSYLNKNYSSTTPAPNPQDWMTKMNSGTTDHILGATRSGNDLWFAWTAAANPPAFPQPYVALVDLDIASDFKVNQQSQIWTPDRSFAYPALATNAATGEIGFSLETGGPGFYENHAVGFVGGVIFITTDSVAGTTRYGDYTTIRQDPMPTLFDAFGYEVLTSPSGTPPNQAHVHYVVFGRPGS
jgi:hypothetical protein